MEHIKYYLDFNFAQLGIVSFVFTHNLSNSPETYLIVLLIDERPGTLFHVIIRICDVKRPKHILLENVKGLKTIRHGNTLKTIIKKLTGNLFIGNWYN